MFIALFILILLSSIGYAQKSMTCADFCHDDFDMCIKAKSMDTCLCLLGLYTCEFRNNCTNPGDHEFMKTLCLAEKCNWCATLN